MAALGAAFIQRIVFQNTKQPFYRLLVLYYGIDFVISTKKVSATNILGNLWIFHNPQSHIIHHFIVFPIYIIENSI